MSDLPVSAPVNEADKSLRIGARVVVELLRMKARPPESAQLSLTPARHKNALAVLRDRLLALQQALPFPEAVPSVASTLAQRCSDLKIPLPIAGPDWGVILLLDELFDRLLENQQLDEQAQAWLGSLRVPVVRYALLDYSFFFAPQNLLRRLLNQIYLILLSSSQKSRQVLRESLQTYLQRLQLEFKQDVSACNRICIEAQTWFAGHSDAVDQIEEKIRVQEISLRKEQVAEPRVVRELNRIAGGRELPNLVVDFLHGEWRRSLQLISMREGEEGATWKRQVRITESLVEMAQGCGDDKGREKYRSFYPVLMKNIKTLLVGVNEDPAALEQAIDPLELILTAMISGAQVDGMTTPILQLSGAHITTVAVKQVGAHALAAIQALHTGDWVRIKTADGSHDVFRLTLKARDDEPWVLVSQSGKTITKKTAFQLAQGYEGGVLDIIGQGRWWDDQLEQKLTQLHQAWQIELASRPPEPPPKPVQPPATPAQREPEPASSSELELLPLDDTDRSEAGADTTASATTPLLPEANHLSEQPQEIDVAVADDTEDFLAPRPISDEERDTALNAIDQIQIGGWIIQQTSQGEERCKLAVKIRGRDKLIFVNRLGVKVLETERLQLAELLARGLVTIVDTGEKFDNTLERVVRSIQEDRKP